MERKIVNSRGSFKATGEGTAVALFSRFDGAPDRDGDITVRGAFREGAEVPVSGWNHSSTNTGALPAGKATIHNRTDHAEAVVRFFVETELGRQTWLTLKALGGSEWSYGYSVVDSEHGRWQGQPVRVLKRVDVFELSPVLRGAGRDTTTLSLRSDSASRAVLDEARRHVAEYDARRVLQDAQVRLIAASQEMTRG